MKNIFFLVICLAFALASQAQSNTDELILLQSKYGLDKQKLVAKHMQISEAQSVEFWKAYDTYELSRKALGQKRLDNIKAYANAYLALTADDANKLMKASFAIQDETLKLWKKTHKEMSKITGSVKATQFIQLEMYLENIIRVGISGEIPLIGEIDAK
jgi:cell division protein FtsX